MSGVSLYAIGADYAAAFAFLDECEGPEDFEAVEKLLAEVVGRFEDKAAAVCAYRAGLEAEADMCDNEVARLKKRAESLRNKGDRLKDYLESEMRRCNLSEVRAGVFTAKFQKNPPAVDIAPGTVLADKYLRITPPPPPAPDKKLIGDDLKSGIDIPGCSLVQKEVLRIK
jgi:hypothetical protein